jgi:hypothetical protein
MRSVTLFQCTMVAAASLFGLALVVATFLAFNRQSGVTKLDPAKIQQMRYQSSQQKRVYHTRSKTLNFDYTRQSSIEASRIERGTPSPSGKGDEESRLSEVAASQNSKSWTECGIT